MKGRINRPPTPDPRPLQLVLRVLRGKSDPSGAVRSGTLIVLLILLLFGVALGYILLRTSRPPASETPRPSDAAVRRGGTLITTLRAEPRTFNSYIGRDFSTEVITHLTQAMLVRVNRVTQQLEPRLAESWQEETTPGGGASYTLKLRDARFSDGTPFTADDVVFAFRAVYDEKTGSPFGDTLRVEGKPLTVDAVDARTVRITFPGPSGPGLRMVDRFPILPRHRLQSVLEAGTLRQAWSPATPPADVAGLGPFVLARYEPGQRLQFKRNPHYWGRDAEGTPLPYLDGITIEIVPDQNAELLRLQAGQIDFTQSEARPEDVGPLRQAAAQGRLALLDLGVGLDADALWFNLRGSHEGARLKPSTTSQGKDEGDQSRSARLQPGMSEGDWWKRVEFRRAVSHAVNRQAFADTVFLGAAVPIFGIITPANKQWHDPNLPRYDFNPEEARRLLASIDLRDRNGDGRLDTPSGQPVRFTLLTQKGNTGRERGSALVRDELARIGVTVDVVPLEVGALVERMMSGKFEAIFFGFLMQSLDPGLNLDFWRSRGGAHVWNPEQAKPATEWEQRIDDLMTRQVATTDQSERKRLVDEAQRILAEQQPILYFAAPRIYLGVSTRTLNAQASVMRPNLLWNAEALAIKQ